ncbi:MAG: pantoate--beta-alanine ligase [Microscillaceae bacterium]|nr:pantoate--beta-alanine ligase [Microscillaceae bacterium]MDW8459832.1 pantoate--beta-alanine ligase [Cytophagales bacterium]
MYIFDTITSLKEHLTKVREQKMRIGFVPTMGALHAGHLSLVKQSLEQCDFTVCSIFVNPIQFNRAEDLANYPRTIEKDISLLASVGCHAVFTPSEAMMYPEKTILQFNFGFLEQVMEGKFRPSHFSGVAVVISKLLHLVQPTMIFLGQKDWQQVVIIRQLVKDLFFPVQIAVGQTVRETDGLAMSSRNMRLNETERQQALAFYQALSLAQELILEGVEIKQIKAQIVQSFENKPYIKLEYFEIVHKDTLENLTTYQPNQTALCIAGYVGEVRLIDNFLL